MKIRIIDADLTVEARVTQGICENHRDETLRPGYEFDHGDFQDFLCRMCFEDPRGRGSYEIVEA
jgi:hypothetical protein